MREEKHLSDIKAATYEALNRQMGQYPSLNHIEEDDVERVLRLGFDSIIEELCKGNKVYLINSLNFEPKDYNDKNTRNPQTGEPMVIPGYRVVNVKPSSAAKRRLKEGRIKYPLR